ncbi:MAG: HXXEE domain-containing protein [Pseudomonadota bacterium]
MLTVAFALLWVPFGQHEFLVAHWMKLGVFMAPFLLFAMFVFDTRRPLALFRDASFLAILMLVAYIVHQAEEHWVDLTGQSYAFHAYVNHMLADVLGATQETEYLTETGVFVVNTSLVWLVGSLAILLGRGQLFPVLCMAALILVNGVSHTAAAFLSGEYNPGLVTAVFPFLPLSVWVFWLFWKMNYDIVLASVGWAMAAHGLLIGGAILSSSGSWFSESLYFLSLVGMSIIPVVIRFEEPVASPPPTP